MTIKRGRQPGTGPVLIDAEAARDNRLTLRARGLLLLVFGFPEDSELDPAVLAQSLPADESAEDVRLALAELERYGYLHTDDDASGN